MNHNRLISISGIHGAPRVLVEIATMLRGYAEHATWQSFRNDTLEKGGSYRSTYNKRATLDDLRDAYGSRRFDGASESRIQ